MSSTKTIGQILLTFLTGTVLFVGYLYYLGATSETQPVEEVLVNGEWMPSADYELSYPGEIYINNNGLYSNPVFLSGEAESAWFVGGVVDAEIVGSDGSLLWEGVANVPDSETLDTIVPFELEADIGSYQGEATVVIYQVDESVEDESAVAAYPNAYTASIVITGEELDLFE